MAGTGVTGPAPGPAARRIVGAYLADLSGRLGGATTVRAAILAELEDGLWAAVAAHQARGLAPDAAARAAVAEFGAPQTVAAGFGPELAAVGAGRVGLGLLSTGPLVGTSWLLLVAATWTRVGHRPPAVLGLVAALVGLVLVVAVPAAVLSIAASGRLSRWLGPRVAPTAAAVAAGACVAGDLVLLASLLGWTLLAGGVAWPAGLVAAGASSVRLSLAGGAARRCLAARAALA